MLVKQSDGTTLSVVMQGDEALHFYTTLDGKYVVKVVTGDNFCLEKMRGDKFKQEHVLDLPFSYIFPARLSSPRLAEGQEWKVALDENFVLVYNAEFKPNSTYEIIIEVE